MSSRNPPLQALRALDAAARHLSYSRAAEELGVTHGAVSHHIAGLETHLRVRLFVRDGQHMAPTLLGQQLARGIRQGLSLIDDALEAARLTEATAGTAVARDMVTISVLPSFATRWLLPRLQAFRQAHPQFEIALRPTVELARLDGRDRVDIAIRYGQGRWAGVQSELLMPGHVFAVASPAYASTLPAALPERLRAATLLRKPGQPWQPWFAAAGIEWPEPIFGPSYDDAGLVLDAAAQGHGLALARAALVDADLTSGRLVRVDGIVIEDSHAWFLAWHEPRGSNSKAVRAFRAWLISEVEYYRKTHPHIVSARLPAQTRK